MAIYAAAKAGVCALTRIMAFEFAPFNIRVNTVAPRGTVTEGSYGKGKDAETMARKKEQEDSIRDNGCIMQRDGCSKELANAIVFLASDEASFITATTLCVDGGRVAL